MKYLILLCAFTTASICFAEGREKIGNGGTGFVCKTTKGTIQSVGTLDLFEGSLPLFPRKTGYSYPKNAVSVDAEIQRALIHAAPQTAFTEALKSEITDVQKIMLVLPKLAALIYTGDANPEVLMKGCNFVQIANYSVEDELNHRIDIDGEFYAAMNNTEKAALVIHEALYALTRRLTGDTDSKRARKITAMLLALEDTSRELYDALGDIVPEPTDKKTFNQDLRACKPGDKLIVEMSIEGSPATMNVSTGDSFGNVKTTTGKTAKTQMTSDCSKFEKLTWLAVPKDSQPVHFSVRIKLAGQTIFEHSELTAHTTNSVDFSWVRYDQSALSL